MAEHRRYSEADKAAALAVLASHNGNVTRAAADLNIPPSTLSKWRDGKGVNADVAEKCEGKKEELADLWERVCRTYLDQSLKPTTLAASSGKDAVIAAATATDKMRLLREQPIVITDDGLSLEDRRSRLAAILERARLERDRATAGPASNGTTQPH